MVAAKEDLDPLVGTTLGGLYRVERLIGEGGMGRVYRATHEHLGKAYAVKVLAERRAGKANAAERFLREARSASRIEHEHIVKVLNFDSDEDNRVFIVMELLHGENLAERLERGPLAIEDAIEIATQTGEALQAAHDVGVVHRDLKPENIFITRKKEQDFVKVLDFGISKIKSPEHTDIKLTATDQIVGTPLYISPELARGVSAIDHRTDVYALGVITYEMITGTPPFTGQNQFQLLYKHGNEAPEPPSQRNPQANIPPHVEAAVLRALEKDPADRFANMQEFCAALKQPTKRRRTKALAVVALLVTALAAAMAAAFFFFPTTELVQPEPAPVTPMSDESAKSSSVPAPAELVRIELDSTPRGALVALNGDKKGQTPLAVELERGAEATVRFSLEGYRSEERRLVADEDDAVVVRLKKKTRRKPPPIKTDF